MCFASAGRPYPYCGRPPCHNPKGGWGGGGAMGGNFSNDTNLAPNPLYECGWKQPLWPRHRVPHWTPSHPVPFHPESLSPHHLVITQHLLLGALVHNKSRLMCAKHRVIAKARFAHPCQS